MMKRKHLLGLALGAAVTLGAGTVAISAASSPKADPHKTVIVDSNTARSTLARALKVPESQLTYDGTVDRPGVRSHEFHANGMRAAVDVSDGHISILSFGAPTGNGKSAITAEAAEEAARAFLADLGSPVDGMTVTVDPETGAGVPGYTVKFIRMDGQVILPDYRVVEVDGATGKVFSLVDVRRPYEAPPAPAVSAKDASANAIAKVHGKTVSATTLTVTFDPQGNQRLVWVVKVESGSEGDPGAIVGIDALTGAVYDLSTK